MKINIPIFIVIALILIILFLYIWIPRHITFEHSTVVTYTFEFINNEGTWQTEQVTLNEEDSNRICSIIDGTQFTYNIANNCTYTNHLLEFNSDNKDTKIYFVPKHGELYLYGTKYVGNLHLGDSTNILNILINYNEMAY